MAADKADARIVQLEKQMADLQRRITELEKPAPVYTPTVESGTSTWSASPSFIHRLTGIFHW